MKIALYSDDYRETKYRTLTFNGTPADLGAGLTEFIEYLRGVLLTITPEDEPIRLEPAYPSYIINQGEQLSNPVITWTVLSLNPANLNGKPMDNPESGVRDVSRRFRTNATVDEIDYEVYGQTFQSFIRFDIWSTEAADAELLSTWFRQYFMEKYGPLSGVAHQRFHTRKADKEISKINNQLHVRSLTYFVQFEEKSAIRMDKIQSIRVGVEQVTNLS